MDISFMGARVSGPVKALVAFFSGTAAIIALVAVIAYHTIDSIKENQQIIRGIGEIRDGINLQNAILIIPQAERGNLAHRLPPEVQKNFGMTEAR